MTHRTRIVESVRRGLQRARSLFDGGGDTITPRAARPVATLADPIEPRNARATSPARRRKQSKSERYAEAAAQLVREAGVVTWHQTAGSLRGRAFWRERTIVTPPPTTLRRFCVVAHECKHIEVGPRTTLHSYEREYECCRAEEEACARFGFPFPDTERARNKKYVAYRLHQGLRRGLAPHRVKRSILRWCWESLPASDQSRFAATNLERQP